jgi:hypothetical protein
LTQLKNTFNYYAAFFLDGYFDTLIETIKEHHHIVMDEEKLKTIVHSLLFDIDSLRGSDYGHDFYATGLFHSPLLTLKDLYGKPVIIGYPEIIELSRRLNQIYDFPNTPTNEKIKSVMEMDFKKFLVKQIERTDRRYNVRYFKYQNKFEYELGNEKKDKMVTQYDQVAFDIGSNYLFFCDEFFFRNEPILWAEWKKRCENVYWKRIIFQSFCETKNLASAKKYETGSKRILRLMVKPNWFMLFSLIYFSIIPRNTKLMASHIMSLTIPKLITS